MSKVDKVLIIGACREEVLHQQNIAQSDLLVHGGVKNKYEGVAKRIYSYEGNKLSVNKEKELIREIKREKYDVCIIGYSHEEGIGYFNVENFACNIEAKKYKSCGLRHNYNFALGKFKAIIGKKKLIEAIGKLKLLSLINLLDLISLCKLYFKFKSRPKDINLGSNNKIKLLFVIHNLGLAGAEKQLYLLLL